MVIKINYTSSDIYVSTNVSPVYVVVNYSGVSTGGGVWGQITGTLSDQTDLQNALNAKFDDPTGTTAQYLRGDGSLATFPAIPSGTVTSVGLTMPSAFAVSNSPVTSSGTLAVTGAGTADQYVRGDGQLANFPTNGGGGSSVNYYLNGSVTQGTFGGDTYYEMSKSPIIGAGTNFTRTNAQGNGYIASFITDAGDPALLNIPGGNWNVEFYFQASSGGGNPSFYAELYKVSSSNVFTLIASASTNPEGITNGTVVDQYFTSISVPQTALLATDRIAIRIFVTPSGRTITLHTENSNLCEVLTTFSTGLNALNGLTAQVQYFATGTSGTDFNISSATDTHTFNLPIASGTNTGKLSNTDWTNFNNKVSSNIYTADGTLTSARTLTHGGFNLTFVGGTHTNRFTSAGRLLLGTTTESTFLLDVNGTARVSGDVTTNGNFVLATLNKRLVFDNNLRYISHVSSVDRLRISQNTFANGIEIGFENNSNVFTPSLFIANSGAATFSSSVTVGNRLTLNGVGTSEIYTTDASGLYLTAATNGGMYLASESRFLFRKATSPFTEYMRIESTGNLLVGTTTDSGYKLDVNGTARVSGATTLGGTVNINTAVWLQYNGSNVLLGEGTNTYLQANGGGSIIFRNNTPSTLMTLNNSGNLGLGVTPSAWRSGDKVIDIGATSSIVNAQGLETRIYQNTYVSSAGVNTYKTTAPAAYFGTSSGAFAWFNAPSGTAGNAITFTQAMTLTSGGNLLVGTTTDNGNRLQVSGAATFSSSVTANDVYAGSGTQGIIGLRAGGAGAAGFMEIFTTNGTTRLGYIGYNTTNMNYVSENSANHVFQTNGNTERMRIKTTGAVRYIPIATPSTAEAGDVYYDSTSNKLRCYNGTSWNDLF